MLNSTFSKPDSDRMKIGLENILKRHRIIKHIVFWLIYIFLNSLMYGQYNGDYLLQIKLQLYYLPAILGATYVTLYILIPRYLVNKKYTWFGIWCIITALFFSLMQRINICSFIVPVYFPENVDQFKIFSVDIFFRILTEFPVVIFSPA